VSWRGWAVHRGEDGLWKWKRQKRLVDNFFLRVDDDDVAVVVVAAVNDTVAGTGSSLDCSFSAMVRLALASSSSNGSQNNRLA